MVVVHVVTRCRSLKGLRNKFVDTTAGIEVEVRLARMGRQFGGRLEGGRLFTVAVLGFTINKRTILTGRNLPWVESFPWISSFEGEERKS